MAKRGRKPKDKKGYFEENEEQAIISFINETDYTKKNRIYNEKLKPAFQKMIESIIRRYKLYVPDEEFDETFSDTLSYLMTKINNFNSENGTKAYSYCGTICKNYLIFKNIQYTKNLNRSVRYEFVRDGLTNDITYADTQDHDDGYDEADVLMNKISEEIQKMVDSPEKHKLNKNEIRVGEAIVCLLKDWRRIIGADEDENDEPIQNGKITQYKSISNKLHKSKILYFLREETMMSTKEVRDNMKKYKSVYSNIKSAMQE